MYLLGLFSLLLFFAFVMQQPKRYKKNAIHAKKILGPARTPGTPGTKGPRSRGPGRTGPRDLEGPVVLAGQDLETLKVPGT